MDLKLAGGKLREGEASAAWEPDERRDGGSLGVKDVLAALQNFPPGTKLLECKGKGRGRDKEKNQKNKDHFGCLS